METNSQSVVLRVLGALVVVIAVGCTTNVFNEGDIMIAIDSEPTTLDPQAREDGGERAINDNVYETLMVRSPDGQLIPGLAKQEPTQLDATTWEFVLREGIRFHNGEPFDADSVVFSVSRILDPELNSEQASFFSTIESATAEGQYTVHIRTKGPDPILRARMYWMKMVSPRHAGSDRFDSTPVGTGPYRFVQWDRGNTIRLERNNDYWGEKPSIPGVNYRFVAESGTRLSGLVVGEFDLINNLLPEFSDYVPNVAHIRGLEIPAIILSSVSGPTQDLRVRQALNFAVDKEALAQNLFEGFAEASPGQLLAPSFFGFNESVTGYPYDPGKARQLLKEAGAEDLEIELVSTSGRWLKDRELVEAVAAFWRDAGVKTNVRIFEFNEYLNRLFDRDTRADGIFVVSSNELFDADRAFSAYYHREGGGASNDDAVLAAYIDEARTETDTGRRQFLYEQASQLAFDQAYFVWMLNIQDVYGLSERLEWTPRVDAKILVSTMKLK